MLLDTRFRGYDTNPISGFDVNALHNSANHCNNRYLRTFLILKWDNSEELPLYLIMVIFLHTHLKSARTPWTPALFIILCIE